MLGDQFRHNIKKMGKHIWTLMLLLIY